MMSTNGSLRHVGKVGTKMLNIKITTRPSRVVLKKINKQFFPSQNI